MLFSFILFCVLHPEAATLLNPKGDEESCSPWLMLMAPGLGSGAEVLLGQIGCSSAGVLWLESCLLLCLYSSRFVEMGFWCTDGPGSSLEVCYLYKWNTITIPKLHSPSGSGQIRSQYFTCDTKTDFFPCAWPFVNVTFTWGAFFLANINIVNKPCTSLLTFFFPSFSKNILNSIGLNIDLQNYWWLLSYGWWSPIFSYFFKLFIYAKVN